MFGGGISVARRGPKTLNWLRLYSQYSKNHQIFVHPDGNIFKYSLSTQAKAVHIGTSPYADKAEASTFKPNEMFVSLLQNTIKKVYQNDFAFIVEAGANAGSFMAIYDFREIPRYGRIPEVDNIFGYVQVDNNGKMVPGTFDANLFYRICNSAGLITLSDYLYDAVRQECEKAGV